MARTLVNLTVHGVGPSSRNLDPGEDRTWVSVEQLERVLDAACDLPNVRITFDDGNDSDLKIGLPRLLERGLSAEFFVLAGRIGEPGRLDAEDVRELRRAGMRVGSHGWAHRDWRRINGQEAIQEFRDASRVLAELTGEPVSSVAIPFGSYDRHVLRHLHKARFTRAYTSDGGRARAGSWLQARNSLRSDMGPDWLRNLVNVRPTSASRVRSVAARAVKRSRG